MRTNITVLLLLILSNTLFAKTKTCADLSNDFHRYKYEKITCVATLDNLEDDVEVCTTSQTNLFDQRLKKYFKKFYHYIEIKQKGLKIPQEDTPIVEYKYSSEFCNELFHDTQKVILSSTKQTEMLNKIFIENSKKFREFLYKNVVTDYINLPVECKREVQNLRYYKLKSNNKKDEIYQLYRKNYVDCVDELNKNRRN